jgi:hypothetical protein
LGLEEYRRTNGTKPEAPDIEDEPEEPPEEDREAALHLFDINPSSLPDLFREFDEAVRPPPPVRSIHLVHSRENIEEA